MTVPSELPVTIAITGRFDDQTLGVLDKQIARFEEQNPDIRVAVLGAPRKEARRHQDYVDSLSAGDTSRDIYVLEAVELAELDASGWLIPLDAYVEKYEIKLGDFLPATIQANTVSGHLAALPWLADGGLLYYRQDLLEQYGKQVPATWNDLRQVALEIKAEESLPSGFVWQGAPYESLTCNALELIWAHGGKVLDEQGQAVFDSPETHAALQEMLDFVTQGASPPEVATYNETSSLSAFGGGEAVFVRNWTYAWDRLNQTDSPVAGRVGLAPLPVSCLGGLSLALSSHSLHLFGPGRETAVEVDFVSPCDYYRKALRNNHYPVVDTGTPGAVADTNSHFQSARLFSSWPTGESAVIPRRPSPGRAPARFQVWMRPAAD